jgi:hypothetical protein
VLPDLDTHPVEEVVAAENRRESCFGTDCHYWADRSLSGYEQEKVLTVVLVLPGEDQRRKIEIQTWMARQIDSVVLLQRQRLALLGVEQRRTTVVAGAEDIQVLIVILPLVAVDYAYCSGLMVVPRSFAGAAAVLGVQRTPVVLAGGRIHAQLQMQRLLVVDLPAVVVVVGYRARLLQQVLSLVQHQPVEVSFRDMSQALELVVRPDCKPMVLAKVPCPRTKLDQLDHQSEAVVEVDVVVVLLRSFLAMASRLQPAQAFVQLGL